MHFPNKRYLSKQEMIFVWQPSSAEESSNRKMVEIDFSRRYQDAKTQYSLSHYCQGIQKKISLKPTKIKVPIKKKTRENHQTNSFSLLFFFFSIKCAFCKRHIFIINGIVFFANLPKGARGNSLSYASSKLIIHPKYELFITSITVWFIIKSFNRLTFIMI